MNLLIPISLNCITAVAFYLADKYSAFKKLSYWLKQSIIGIVFGMISAFASSFGVAFMGTVVNVRDAAPLTAGLAFGVPSGIISGLIGGLYRWFSVYWGAGTDTQLACTIATILAGLMAAGIRKLMFDNKKPTWAYAVYIAIVCEVIHMLLIFITNMSDTTYAFLFVKAATVPMIIGNVAAVGISIVLISLLSHERLIEKRNKQRIAQTFQRWLFLCIIIAFLVTSLFTFLLQNGVATIETEKAFTSAINDVKTDVRGKSDDYLINTTRKIANIYQSNPSISLAELALNNSVTEINIIDKQGMVLNSTDTMLIGKFNMNSTEQSKAFFQQMTEQGYYVQEYGPVGSDGRTMRKFAGVTLSENYYIQIGYSSEQFHTMLDEFVVDVTKNRHVGSEGFVAVCNEKLCLVTDNEYNGKHISVIGINPDENMLNGLPAKELGETQVVNDANRFSSKYIYAYTFVEGYCIIAAMPKDEAMLMRDTSLYISIFMQVLIFATLFVFVYFLIKKVIINNLKRINRALAQITNGNLDITVNVRTNQEFASLSDDINSTVATLKRYISEAEARIDKELEYAKQIQLSALPTNYPNNNDYGIFAQMIAAKEVGGDFYDYYKLDESNVAFLVADVSGKGIPAAMFMMTAKTIIKDLAESGMAVNDIFIRANEKLCENNESGMFVTAWMGILNISTGELQYANAGHNPPLLKRADGSYEYLRSRGGFILAGMEGMQYRANQLQLMPGDRLFLYTDGVTEATDTQNQLYGEERLVNYLNQNLYVPATELLPALKANIDSFVGNAPQFDDITMLMLDYKPVKGGVAMENRLFPAETSALSDVIGYIEANLESYDCPLKAQMAICVAIEEIFVNIANYAYGEGNGNVCISMGYDTNNKTVQFRISDKGIPFDPLKQADPDITLSAEERQIGGLGIFITKKTMDTIAYSYKDGENILTMTKKI